MRNQRYQKLISTVTSLLLMVSSAPTRANEYHDSAEEALRQQKALADAWAESLVATDFRQTFMEITTEIQEANSAGDKFRQFLLDKGELEKKFIDFSSVNLKDLDMSTRTVQELQERYDDLVRERYDLSWIPVQTDARYRRMGPLMRQVADSFRATCQGGRSDIKFNAAIPTEPPPPPYYYEFMINVSGNSEGGYATPSYRGYNYRTDHKTRKDIIEGSGAVASISGSILLNGAAGATLTCASYAFPIATAVLVTALVVEHFENLANKNRIAGEIARAEEHKFVHTKRDDYVADKYRELCGERAKRLDRITEIIQTLEADGPEAKELIASHESRVAEFQALQKKLQEADAARCRVELAEAASRKLCAAEDAPKEKKEKSGCTINEKGVANLLEPRDGCRVQVDKDGEYSTRKADIELKSAIKPEEIQGLTEHKIVMSLGLDRRNFLQSVNQSNWNSVSKAQQEAFSKLLQFINLARRMGNAKLLGPAQKVDREIEATKTFEGLRGRFIDVVALAVKVSFGTEKQSVFVAALTKWEADFKSFFRTHLLNKDARSLESSLLHLKGIMNVR